MQKKHILIGLSIIATLILIFVIIAKNVSKIGSPSQEKTLRVVENVSIETPHPYPNSDSGRKVVWSYTLKRSGAQYFGLHFNKFEVNGEINTPIIYETVDFGDCNLSNRDFPNVETVILHKSDMEKSSVEKIQLCPGERCSPGSVVSVSCGIGKFKKEFTPQEIFDNSYIKGDFILIKGRGMIVEGRREEIIDILVGKDGKISSAIGRSIRDDKWWNSLGGFIAGSIKIELYSDNSDNAYGVNIDEVRYGEIVGSES